MPSPSASSAPFVGSASTAFDPHPAPARNRARRVRLSLQGASAAPVSGPGVTTFGLPPGAINREPRCNTTAKGGPNRRSHTRVQTGCMRTSDEVLGTHSLKLRLPGRDMCDRDVHRRRGLACFSCLHHGGVGLARQFLSFRRVNQCRSGQRALFSPVSTRRVGINGPRAGSHRVGCAPTPGALRGCPSTTRAISARCTSRA
jgi:hypothetical protein